MHYPLHPPDVPKLFILCLVSPISLPVHATHRPYSQLSRLTLCQIIFVHLTEALFCLTCLVTTCLLVFDLSLPSAFVADQPAMPHCRLMFCVHQHTTINLSSVCVWFLPLLSILMWLLFSLWLMSDDSCTSLTHLLLLVACNTISSFLYFCIYAV